MSPHDVKRVPEDEIVLWKTNHLHGIYNLQIEEIVGSKKSYQWLEKAGLKHNTELIMAA